MTGELAVTALTKFLDDRQSKIAEQIMCAWYRVPEQKFLEFLMNAGWWSARNCIIHPRPWDVSNELLAQICKDFITSRRQRPPIKINDSASHAP